MAVSRYSKIRDVEKSINRNLFIITGFTTLLVIGLGLLEYFTRGEFPGGRIHVFYIGLLALYSLHKEMLRWMDEKSPWREGESGLCISG